MAVLGLSVEPVNLVFALGSFAYTMGTQHLFLQKECSPGIRPDINEICSDSEAVATASDISTLRTILRSCLASVTVILASSWREQQSGRTRALFLYSILGEILAVGVCLLGAYLWSVNSWLLASAEGLVLCVTGGFSLLTLASTVYLTEHTTPDQRTNRIALTMVAYLTGAGVAQASSGYILTYLGFSGFFLSVMVLFGVSFLLVFVFIQEGPIKEQTVEEKDGGGSLFNISRLKIVFKSRPNNFLIWCMMITGTLSLTTFTGEFNVYTYYLEQKFNFTVEETGVFTSFRTIGAAGGPFILVPLATKLLHWSDFTIIITCCIFGIIQTIGLSFSATQAELIAFGFLDWARIIYNSTAKSIMSKHLRKDEVGIFFSLATIGDAIGPTIILPLYSWVFNSTVKTLPGAFFLLSAGLVVLNLLLAVLSAIFRENINFESEKPTKAEQKEDMNT